MTFLFWNIHSKPLESHVARLAFRHEVDVIMLAECMIPPGAFLPRLNSVRAARFFLSSADCDRVAVYTRFSDQFMRRLETGKRYTIWRVVLPFREEILLVAAHLRSKLFLSASSQASQCREFATAIRRAEEQVGHSRTLAVGDLNMNPFEEGVVAADGLHGVMTRKLAARRTRKVQSEEYPFFYNPMWGLFGDAGRRPPGTFYFERAEHFVYFWNMFDQVLVRPDLMRAFRNRGLRILDSDGSESLLDSKGQPNSSAFSDHLPILFNLKLEQRRSSYVGETR